MPLKTADKGYVYGCKAAQVKVCNHWLRLLRPKLNGGPVCDDSAAEGGVCANVAL